MGPPQVTGVLSSPKANCAYFEGEENEDQRMPGNIREHPLWAGHCAHAHES